jgi:hypothetical protein
VSLLRFRAPSFTQSYRGSCAAILRTTSDFESWARLQNQCTPARLLGAHALANRVRMWTRYKANNCFKSFNGEKPHLLSTVVPRMIK